MILNFQDAVVKSYEKDSLCSKKEFKVTPNNLNKVSRSHYYKRCYYYFFTVYYCMTTRHDVTCMYFFSLDNPPPPFLRRVLIVYTWITNINFFVLIKHIFISLHLEKELQRYTGTSQMRITVSYSSGLVT